VFEIWCLGCLLCLGLFLGGFSSEAYALSEGSKQVMDKMTVTATKTEVDPDTVPFTMHTVDREDIDSQPTPFMNNLGEFIRDVPGVHVAQYYPWGPPWIHLRGTGYFIGRTIYLVDGLPLHSFLSVAVNPNDVEKVDVLLGPSSALYGPNASGGAVNYITRKGKKGMGALGRIAYGSNNTVRPHARVGDRVGNFNYYLSYSGDYSDGYQMKPLDGMLELYHRGKKQYLREASYEDNEYQNSWLAGNFGWESERGTSLQLSLNFNQRYLYGGQKNLILNDDGQILVSSLKFETPLASIGKFKATFGYQHDDHPQQYTNGLSLPNGHVVLDPTVNRRRDWTREHTPFEVQTDFYLGKNNILTTGVFWSREKEKRTDHYVLTGASSTSEWTTDQTAVYLQDQQMFLDDRLTLMAGVRYDHWRYHDVFIQSADPQRPDEVKKDTTTYRGGVKYRINDNFALRGSVGTAFWPGTALWFFQTVKTGTAWREANPDLEPEKTWMSDMGLDVNFPSTGTYLGATFYYGEIRDMVSYSYDENPYVEGGSIIRTKNLGKAEIYGLELKADQRITDELSLFAALTLNHSRIADDPNNEGNQLRNAPDYWGSVGLRYLNPDLFNAEALVRFSDSRYYDDANTDLPYFHMDSYETMDAKIWRDWKLSNDLILTTQFSAVNIFDKEYATEIVYVNPGRFLEATVGLKYLF
jgi:iron complex outermembrane receptor protein